MKEENTTKKNLANTLVPLSQKGFDIPSSGTERKRQGECLKKMSECFLNFKVTVQENINRLVSICGEFMGATFALYNRLEKGMLSSAGKWQAPKDYKPLDRAEGRICYDVIRRSDDTPFIARNLQNSPYAKTDPNVMQYRLQTYVGIPVKFDGTHIGVLCVVFQKDFIPTIEDLRFMEIIASAIAVEEDRRQTQLTLEESRKRYQRISDTVTDYIYTVYIKDGQPVETVHGPRCVTVTGYSAEEFAADQALWIKMVPEEDRQAVFKHAALILLGEKVPPLEHRIIKKDGTLHWVRNTTVSHFDADGRLLSYDGLIQDITERKKAEMDLQKNRQELQIIFDSAPTMVFYKDRDNRMIRVNKSFAETMGLDRNQIEGKTCFELWPNEAEHYWSDDKEVMQSGRPKIGIVEPLVTSKGRIWVETDKIPYRNDEGNIIGVIGFAIDITERKQTKKELELLNKELIRSNKRLRQLVLRDPQTGLYNHRYVEEVIEAEFHRAERYGHPFSVTMLDVDYFKSINDVYGFHFGDLVLRQLARQLKRMVHQYDIVIRFGGEEFMIISPGINRTQALSLAQRILDTINLYDFGDKKQTVKLKLSIAVASYPEDKIARGMDLVALTDEILNKVKEYGGDKIYSSLDIRKKKPLSMRKIKVNGGVRYLKDKIEKLTKRTNQSLIEAVFAFAKTIELKDHFTGEHVERTVQYATEIARALDLPEDEIDRIKQAAILHDLGKIGISEKILVKKLKLTKEEFEEIKKHPQIGVDIIRPIKFLHNIIPLILYHHERWDGKGYPNGLKGEEVPIGARVVAVADVFQALTSDRPYRKAYSEEEALKIIKKSSGTQFDPRVVDKFLQIMQKKK